MERVIDAVESGTISLIASVVITAAIAQVLQPPWMLEGILVAVAVASFFSGLCSRYFATGKETA